MTFCEMIGRLPLNEHGMYPAICPAKGTCILLLLISNNPDWQISYAHVISDST